MFHVDHIGKGEGAQVYGWGLYFAEKKEVGEFYRDKLAQTVKFRGKEVKLTPKINFSDDEYAFAIQFIAKQLVLGISFDEFVKQLTDSSGAKSIARTIKKEKITAEDFVKILKGKLYEVEIPDDGYLLWDKPLFLNTNLVLDIIKETFKDYCIKTTSIHHDRFMYGANAYSTKELHSDRDGSFMIPDEVLKSSGEDFYNQLKKPIFCRNPEHTSKYLNSHGIIGIKYLDQTSRGIGEGTYNYVLFDHSQIKIKKIT